MIIINKTLVSSCERTFVLMTRIQNTVCEIQTKRERIQKFCLLPPVSGFFFITSFQQHIEVKFFIFFRILTVGVSKTQYLTFVQILLFSVAFRNYARKIMKLDVFVFKSLFSSCFLNTQCFQYLNTFCIFKIQIPHCNN